VAGQLCERALPKESAGFAEEDCEKIPMFQKNPTRLAWSASSPTGTLVHLEALVFATGHHPLTAQRSEGGSDDGVPALPGAVVAIEHNPVSSLASPVRSRCVREQCSVPAGTAARVEDR
jgi:hypothetical protein